MACNNPAFRFKKYLKTMSDKLPSNDIRKLRFLCKDLLTTQSLEKVTRGLHLFSALEKMMLLTKEDVSLIIELMELIWRIDLVNITRETWDETCTYSKKQRISPYRQLLLTVAQEVTKEDLDGVKCLANECITSNIEEVHDMLEVISIMENECVISSSDVDILCEILPHEKDKQKVYAYKRDVLGRPIPASSPPEEMPTRGSYSHYGECTGAKAPSSQRQAGIPYSMGAPSDSSSHYFERTNTPPLPQQAGNQYLGAPPGMGVASQQYAYTYMNQQSAVPPGHSPLHHYVPFPPQAVYPLNHQQYHSSGYQQHSYYDYYHQPLPRTANLMCQPHRWPSGNAAPPDHHQPGPQPSQVPQRQPPGGNLHLQHTPPRPERKPMENTSPPDHQQYTSGQALFQNDSITSAAPGSHPIAMLPNQQYGSNLPDSVKLTKESDNQDNMHNVQPQSSSYDSFNQESAMQRLEASRSNELQIGQEVRRSTGSGRVSSGEGGGQLGQEISGLEGHFASLKVDHKGSPTYSSNQPDDGTRFELAGATNISDAGTAGVKPDSIVTSITGISSAFTLALTDTFPKELRERIDCLCSNNSDLQLLISTQTTTNTVDNHLLGEHRKSFKQDFDGPLHLPSVANISPSDLKVPDPKVIPCYQMTHDIRGLAIIINNEHFVKKNPHNFEFREGAYKDAGILALLFRSLKFEILCKSNLSMQEMHDILDEVRRYDHQQYDCFVCCILTHGQMGEVYGSDSLPIRIEELLGLFNGVKCKTLRGKPKLFFIQACQGNVKQPGRPVQMDQPPSDPKGIIDTIPITNDYLVGYSTSPGYASFRSPDDGSWYIIALVRHIKELHGEVDMANVLALVNGYMSRCSDKEGCKQSSPYRSTLTKPLFL